MPFTFAHPAAVLPLQKYCPKFLSLPALVVGSLMPDLGYYMHNWVWSISGHAFLGSLTFDVPSGLLVLSLFYLTIRPLARLLPYPHREACSAICPVIALPGFRSTIVAAFSLLLGAWTHIIWDGFTHANGWCVRQFSSVTPTLFSLGSYHVTVWHILQHCSTMLGLILLMTAYSRYLESKRFLRHRSLLGPKTRTALWSLLLTLPAVRAFFENIALLSRGLSLPGLDEFIFNATVSYVCVFLPLVCLSGVIVSILEYLFLQAKQPVAVPAVAAESNRLPLPPPGMPAIISVLSVPTETMPLPVESFSKQASI